MEQNYPQHYIIFDIDSNSIGTLVFERIYNKKTKKNIYNEVFSVREKITKGQNLDFDTFFKRTIKTFESVAEKAHKYSGNDISGIYINVAAPWASSQKRVIHFEKKREFIFTKDLADKIIKKELNESLHHTQDFKDHKNLVLIERRTVDVFVNGYPTKNPYNISVKDADIHSLITVMSKKTYKAFSHVIEKAFHSEPKFFSNTFMTYQSLIELFPNENNITSIDISGEVTEINIIIDDHLKKIGTISTGSNGVVRYLADFLKIPYTKAESLISMYQNDNLEKKYKNSIETAMNKSFLSWFKHFYNFLDQVSTEHLIPENISLLAPEWIQNWFNESLLRSEELREHMHLGKNIRLLDLKMLFKTTNRKELKMISDDNLAMCLYFVEKHFVEDKNNK